ncbi:MAG: hypothetical protein QXS81_04325 [Candidatus Micrarchaeaceae archaeon]
MGKKNKKSIVSHKKLGTHCFLAGIIMGAFFVSSAFIALLLIMSQFSAYNKPQISNKTLFNTSFAIESGQNGTISTAMGQSSIFRAGNITEVLVANLTGYLAINISLRNSSQTVIATLFPYFKNLHNLPPYYLSGIGLSNATYTVASLNQTEGTLIYPIIANETIKIKLYNYYYVPLYGSIRINEIGKRA